MAFEQTVGGNGALFVGEDKTLTFEILAGGEDPDDASATPENITGFTLVLLVRPTDGSNATLLSVAGSVTGTYSATRSANTQRASVALTSAQMDTFEAGTYRYSLKRTDSGAETILAYGPFLVEVATQR